MSETPVAPSWDTLFETVDAKAYPAFAKAPTRCVCPGVGKPKVSLRLMSTRFPFRG